MSEQRKPSSAERKILSGKEFEALRKEAAEGLQDLQDALAATRALDEDQLAKVREKIAKVAEQRLKRAAKFMTAFNSLLIAPALTGHGVESFAKAQPTLNDYLAKIASIRMPMIDPVAAEIIAELGGYTTIAALLLIAPPVLAVRCLNTLGRNYVERARLARLEQTSKDEKL